MNKCYIELPKDEQNEDELIITMGDSILYQFYCGNYGNSIEEMIEEGITPKHLIQYLEEKADCYDVSVSELYNNHFTLSYFLDICESYLERLNNVNN